MIVYKITNKIDGMSYIGQTIKTLNHRWSQHCTNNPNCTRIHRAIMKYGKENFTIEVIAECISIEEMNEVEKYYIELHNTLSPNGYNLTTGGLNFKRSKETKKKLSKIAKNRIYSNETKDKMSKTKTGKKQSDETKKKIGDANRGEKNANFGKSPSKATIKRMSASKMGSKNHRFGVSPSIESRAKMSKSNKAKRQILCHELNKSFESIHQASRELDIRQSTISAVLSGRLKNTKGLTFSYI